MSVAEDFLLQINKSNKKGKSCVSVCDVFCESRDRIKDALKALLTPCYNYNHYTLFIYNGDSEM